MGLERPERHLVGSPMRRCVRQVPSDVISSPGQQPKLLHFQLKNGRTVRIDVIERGTADIDIRKREI